MPFPAYGAFGHGFAVSRLIQIVALISVVGLTAHCIAEMIEYSVLPFPTMIGTIAIGAFAILYVSFTSFLYLVSALPLHLTAACDAMFFIGFLLISALMGDPVALLHCQDPVHLDESIYSPQTEKRNHEPEFSAGLAPFVQRNTFDKSNRIEFVRITYHNWMSSSKESCQMTKGVWGLGLVLMTLFLASAVCSSAIWFNLRKQNKEQLESKVNKLEKVDSTDSYC
ncbi:hypothetical protein DFH27DRAFT_220640 [Peziza echinospora]|nr:hypothetical protein DFH27DRAFT_220640 [Peziza echinospora]